MVVDVIELFSAAMARENGDTDSHGKLRVSAYNYMSEVCVDTLDANGLYIVPRKLPDEAVGKAMERCGCAALPIEERAALKDFCAALLDEVRK